jgi:hypothetical protein
MSDVTVNLARDPVVFEFIADAVAAKGYDGVDSAYGPEHAGSLEPGTNHGFATGFDNTGADE